MNICDNLLHQIINEIPQRIEKDVDVFFKDIESPLVKNIAKQHLSDTIAIMQEHLKDFVTTQDGSVPATVLADEFKKMVSRKTIDLINDFTQARNGIKKFDQISRKSKTKKGMVGAIKSYFQDIREAVQAEERIFGSIVDNIFDTLETSGKPDSSMKIQNARIVFYDMLSGGDRLKTILTTQYGIKEADIPRTIWMAAKQGTSKIPELDIIMRAIKKIDETTVNRAKQQAPYFNKLDDYVLPTYANKDKLLAADKDEFTEWVMQNVDLDKLTGKDLSKVDNAAELVAEEVEKFIDMKTRGGAFEVKSLFQDPKKAFGHRKFMFETEDAEWEFLERYGNVSDNILYDIMAHKKKILTSTALYNNVGATPKFHTDVLYEHIKSKGIIEDDNLIIQNIDKSSFFMQKASKPISQFDEMFNDASDTINAWISAVLTGKSTIRDVVYDQTTYSAIQSSMINETGVISEFVKTTWGLLKDSVRYNRTKELSKLFESQGLAIEISAMSKYMGLQEAMQMSRKQSKVARVSERIAKGVSKFTLADTILRASRVNKSVQVNKTFLQMLDGELGETKVIASYLDDMGFGAPAIDILKKAKRISHNGKEVMIDIESIMDLPDSAFKRFIRAGESAKSAKLRLASQYRLFLQNWINDLTATTSIRGQVFSPTNDNVANRTLGVATRFSNIALSQTYNQQRVSLRAQGLDPNYIGHLHAWDLSSPIMDLYKAMKGNPTYVGKFVGGAIVSSIISQWIKDIYSGNTPREITAKGTLEEMVALSGVGGLFGIIMNNMYYSDDVLATPLGGTVVRPGKQMFEGAVNMEENVYGEYVWSPDTRKMGRAGGKVAKKLPFMDTWLTRAATDALFRKGIGMEMSNYEKSQLKKRNQEKIIE